MHTHITVIYALFTLNSVLCSLGQTLGDMYYVVTTNSCPFFNMRCITLSEFALTNPSHYSETTLVFLSGTHFLNMSLTISNHDSFQMSSATTVARIVCTNYSRIIFNSSQLIQIMNLEFIGCGGNEVKNVTTVLVENTKFTGSTYSETSLELIETIGSIVNCTFLSNTVGKLKEIHYSFYEFTQIYVGGAIVVTNSSIFVHHSYFENNRAQVGGAMLIQDNSILVAHSTTFRGNEVCKHHENCTWTSGAAIALVNSTAEMQDCHFENNKATFGGALYSIDSIVSIRTCHFDDNSATEEGGVISSLKSHVLINSSIFEYNYGARGGVIVIKDHEPILEQPHTLPFGHTASLLIRDSVLENNYAEAGGVLVSQAQSGLYSVFVSIQASIFHNNFASQTGVLAARGGFIRIETSTFVNNSAEKSVGVMSAANSFLIIEASMFKYNLAKNTALFDLSNTYLVADNSIFSNNTAYDYIFYAIEGSKFLYRNSLLIANNIAPRSDVTLLLSNSYFSGDISGPNKTNFTFSSNVGSFVAFNSHITLVGNVSFFNNSNFQKSTASLLKRGGAITLFNSNLHFDGTCSLQINEGVNGGAVFSEGSNLHVDGNVTIEFNWASRKGGGMYLSNSELNCQQNSSIILSENSADYSGGGIHAIGSTIWVVSSIQTNPNNSELFVYSGSVLSFTENSAKYGGGLSLEANGKVYVEKHSNIYITDNSTMNNKAIEFILNSADYGGALYVDDDTNTVECAINPNTDCFFQVLLFYSKSRTLPAFNGTVLKSFSFSQNHARVSGSILYGGLLDRCSISSFAEVYNYFSNDQQLSQWQSQGLDYFQAVSDIEMNSTIFTPYMTESVISSRPVRLCFCNSSTKFYDCKQQKSIHVQVKKGELFTVPLIAVDQTGHPVGSATVQATFDFSESRLTEGQQSRLITGECTNMPFNVFSPHDTESLTLFASDGPCKAANFSKATIEIRFLPCNCLIGLQPLELSIVSCTCVCHQQLSQYVAVCDTNTGSFVKQSQSRSWISYINGEHSSGYIVYSNCPFHYCNSLAPINLNLPNGSDAQCAFNRSSLLCGSCKKGFSLSLGSSACLSCPNHWPALLVTITIAALFAGIMLVALLFLLNMSVAVGTLNGLIFYVNIIYANKGILLPFEETNFVTVFVSWLNLELGIDTCYFPGMDTYVKVWLKLAFPVYLIFLVVLVITISSFSKRFSNLIGRKDPVAMLATLVLLSYAKLVDVSFKSLSIGILNYPDGSTAWVWLPDATVKYLSGKHIVLFIVAILILIVGLIYTTIVILSQWFNYLPRWTVFKWSRNQKLKLFIETYSIPYTSRHRYWTGLLLLFRATLYLVDAVNVSNIPQISLASVTFTVCCILVLKGVIGTRLYKNWPIDLLETLFYLNILFLTIFTWYSLGNDGSTKVTAVYSYISVIFTLFLLVLVMVYHIYAYTSLFSRFMLLSKFKKALERESKETEQSIRLSVRNDDVLELLEVSENPTDANEEPKRSTFTVVERDQTNQLPRAPETSKGTTADRDVLELF